MKNLSLVLTLFFALGCYSSANAASYASSLEFVGGVLYSSEGDLSFEEDLSLLADILSDELGDGIELNNGLLQQFDETAPYYLTGFLGYEFDCNLPGWSCNYDWSLELNDFTALWYVEGENFTLEDGFDPIDLGPLPLDNWSLADVTGMESKEQALAFLSGLPTEGYDPAIGGYYVDGDLQSGMLYFALEEDFIGWILQDLDIPPVEFAALGFAGELVLTATGDACEPVPEPATMLLFGTGLAGLAGTYRRKNKKE